MTFYFDILSIVDHLLNLFFPTLMIAFSIRSLEQLQSNFAGSVSVISTSNPSRTWSAFLPVYGHCRALLSQTEYS